jgi:hypothetical protein
MRIPDMRIFYRHPGSERLARPGDVGIDVEPNEQFPGIHRSLKQVKNSKYYAYQKKFHSIWRENKDSFSLNGEDVFEQLEPFFVRTYGFFGQESLGNLLALIDILQDTRFEEEVTCYVSSPTARNVIEQYCSARDVRVTFISRSRVLTPRFLVTIGLSMRLVLRGITGLVSRKIPRAQRNIALKTLVTLQTLYGDETLVRKEYAVAHYELTNTISRGPDWNQLRTDHHLNEFYTLRHLFRVMKSSWLNRRRKHVGPIKYRNIDLTEATQRYLEWYAATYLILVADGIHLARTLCKRFDTILFPYTGDTLTKALHRESDPSCRRISVQRELIFPGCNYTMKTKPSDTEVLVWNDYGKRILVEQYAYESEDIKIIGNLRFTHHIQRTHHPFTITFTHQDAYPEALRFFLRAISRVKRKDVRFLIKPHPVENPERFKKMIRGIERTEIFAGTMNECLSETDVMITFWSTTIYDSINSGIPTIIINPSDEVPLGVPFYKHLPCFDDENRFTEFLEKNIETIQPHNPKEFMMPKYRSELIIPKSI